MSPAKLKKRMISIATPDKLTDIPANTVNLLAWNGGVNKNGSSEFTFEDTKPAKQILKDTIRDEVEMIEKEGFEWMEKVKGFLKKEVEGAL
jgi:cerevisin